VHPLAVLDDQLRQPRLIDRHPARLQQRDLLDIDVDICINLNVPGLLNIDVNLDVEIDIDLLSQNYPTYKSLYCCPDKQCKKGQKVRKEKCWEHEFDNKYKHGKGGKY